MIFKSCQKEIICLVDLHLGRQTLAYGRDIVSSAVLIELKTGLGSKLSALMKPYYTGIIDACMSVEGNTIDVCESASD